MSYIVESGASRTRRSRRRRAFVTLLVVALMLFFAFWYAYSYYRSSGEAVAAPAPTCATAAPAKAAAATAPKPADITVNVYNATSRDGLAGKTASDVRERGFKVATVTNDPLQRTVAGTAEVRYGKSGAAKAKVVLALVKGAKPVRDARTDASVDLVVGEKFTALTAPAQQATAPSAGATVPACR